MYVCTCVYVCKYVEYRYVCMCVCTYVCVIGCSKLSASLILTFL